MSPARTLILVDGSQRSLLACGFVRESLTGQGRAPDDPSNPDSRGPLVLPFTSMPHLDEQRVDAILRHAEMFSMRVVECIPDLPIGLAANDAEDEAHRLLAATYLAAGLGCDEVLWPAGASTGDNLDLDRIAQINDTALLVSRLVALNSAQHGVPAVHVSAPFSQLTESQVLDLVMDMDLPIEACCAG